MTNMDLNTKQTAMFKYLKIISGECLFSSAKKSLGEVVRELTAVEVFENH
jgi:hypothetical protein